MSEVDEAYQLLNAGKLRDAVAHLERSGRAGDATSFIELGVWYLEGRQIPRDLSLARESFRLAGEMGEPGGERVYICFLANGVGGEADWGGAKERLGRLAARDPNAALQIELVEAMALDDKGYPRTLTAGRQLSTAPQVWSFERFASPDECRYLINAAEPLLQQSVVVDPATGQLRPHPVRTSDGASFPWASEDLVISALNRRMAMASGTDVECGEPLQVLRYRPGQEYRPHLDALPGGGPQRVLTMLIYLNDGYEGGDTYFTRTGLSFAGKTGDALLFRNASPGGSPDPNAEHAGRPVIRGEKMLASRWIRERPTVAR